MLFLKILGWICIPYIMIYVQWKRLGTGMRVLGIIYSLHFLVGVIGNMTIPDQVPQTSASSDFSESANSNNRRK
ncbi:hypothetical protein GCM10010918_33920 [Paenibacillus radicis (ex Gao et al. 2016)]|uniref:Uncharacterized protein n=1 Tax=Paenibacillus radicis (ex Gao et al. 2016) TaxID=1737354 RepID=A0A917HE13_9BACL|nr:hypothetical protein GCM10010918_33920 [Paenibacillus radicis (ex Gao et al. 2016)]